MSTLDDIRSQISRTQEINLPNPKRLEWVRTQEENKNRYNPTITGFLGPYLVPIGLVSLGYFVVRYLYHQFVPLEELLGRDECLVVLTQIRKAWGVAITESSRQETKLLDDYSHLSMDQQAHLLDVLRQTLISDLDLTETQICHLYSTTPHQVKRSVEYYTKTIPRSEQTIKDEQIGTIVNDITKFVQLVLPQPQFPLGWTLSDAIELLSQWFELRICVMERTFDHLVATDEKFIKIQPIISPISGKPTTRVKLSQDQLSILNQAYQSNVETQVQTFCGVKGISYPFLLQLNRCVMNTDEFAHLTVRYREEQMKRLIILGIEVAGSRG